MFRGLVGSVEAPPTTSVAGLLAVPVRRLGHQARRRSEVGAGAGNFARHGELHQTGRLGEVWDGEAVPHDDIFADLGSEPLPTTTRRVWCIWFERPIRRASTSIAPFLSAGSKMRLRMAG